MSLRESPQSLAADPDVQRALARIPRQPTRQLPVEPYDKVRMKEVGKRMADVEETAEGVRTRVRLLEARLEKLLNERKNIALLTDRCVLLESLVRELGEGQRNLADSIEDIWVLLRKKGIKP